MISHHHKALYVHVPKCGGESIELAFLADLGLDWNQREQLLIRRNNDPQAGPRQLSHLSAKQYLELSYVTPEQFNQYYKFATVRDPIARVVSFYNYLWDYYFWLLIRKHPHQFVPAALNKSFSINTFLYRVIATTFADDEGKRFGTRRYLNGYYYFLRPQADYLFDKDRLLVDEYFRLEEIDRGWPRIRERCGLTGDLPRRNESRKLISKADLSEKHIRTIRSLYAEDFEKLGYAA